MERTFDPKRFLDLAKTLLEDGSYHRESRARTAIGRFYYAAFLLAQRKLQEKGITIPDDSKVHQVVIEKYMERGLSIIGNRLDQLREKRVDADYHMRTPITTDLARNCSKLTEYLIQLIERA